MKLKYCTGIKIRGAVPQSPMIKNIGQILTKTTLLKCAEKSSWAEGYKQQKLPKSP